MATIALASTGAILSDLNASIPRVVHSLPFKFIGMFAILYGTSKSMSMALRGMFLFVVLMFVLVSVESIISPPGESTDVLDKLEHIVA